MNDWIIMPVSLVVEQMILPAPCFHPGSQDYLKHDRIILSNDLD